MNRKNLPVIIMLVAGAIASIIGFVKDWGISQNLLILLITLLLFYGLGELLEKTLDYFDVVNEKREQEQIQLFERQRTEAIERAMKEGIEEEQ